MQQNPLITLLVFMLNQPIDILLRSNLALDPLVIRLLFRLTLILSLALEAQVRNGGEGRGLTTCRHVCRQVFVEDTWVYDRGLHYFVLETVGEGLEAAAPVVDGLRGVDLTNIGCECREWGRGSGGDGDFGVAKKRGGRGDLAAGEVEVGP